MSVCLYGEGGGGRGRGGQWGGGRQLLGIRTISPIPPRGILPSVHDHYELEGHDTLCKHQVQIPPLPPQKKIRKFLTKVKSLTFPHPSSHCRVGQLGKSGFN